VKKGGAKGQRRTREDPSGKLPGSALKTVGGGGKKKEGGVWRKSYHDGRNKKE